MALPADFDTVTVFGNYIDIQGNPVQGTVTFSPPKSFLFTSESAKETIVPKDISVTLVNGQFSIDLPCTNDPDVLPTGWVYNVTESLPGAQTSFQMEVPVGSDPIDIRLIRQNPALPTNPTLYATIQQMADLQAQIDAIAGSTTQVPDASTTEKGLVQLAGDLAGTAISPSVPKLTDLQNQINNLPATVDASTTNKGVVKLAGDLAGTADNPTVPQLVSLQSQVDDLAPASSATATVQGLVKLAGDLAGTADAPTVPGLANKVSVDTTYATDPGDGQLRKIQINYTVSISSADIEQVYVASEKTRWFNEAGMLRGTPASYYKDDALVRGVPRSDLTSGNNGCFNELQNVARTLTAYGRRWRDGVLIRNGVPMADALVLGPSDSVPANTPVGTIIVRKSS